MTISVVIELVMIVIAEDDCTVALFDPVESSHQQNTQCQQHVNRDGILSYSDIT